MKKEWFVTPLVLGITVLFICTNVNPSFAFDNAKKPSISFSEGNTLYVGGNGPGNYTRIQDAIDNASDGDTVFVYNGTYYESIPIYTSINLIGEDKYTTVIDSQYSSHVLNFLTDWINVSGFTITNSRDWTNDCGIHIQNAWGHHTTHNTITNNIFTFHDNMAITVYQSEYNTITDNIFMNNTATIETGSYSYYNNISNNTIIDGEIYLWGAPNYNVVSNNHIIRGGITVSRGGYNIVIDNIIEDGADIKLMVDTKNNIVENNILISSNAIVLQDSISNTVQNNEFIDSRGISISGNNKDYWQTHIIENNSHDSRPILYYKNQNAITIPSNAAQVILASCNNCIIKNLNISNVNYGIQLGFSNDNNIFSNEFYDNICNCIRLYTSSNNNIFDNLIKNNLGTGIVICGSSCLNIIHDNFIEKNKEYGVYIAASKNSIYKNNFKENTIGIYIHFSFYNTISKNNFINNFKYQVTYTVNYLLHKSNKFKENYYDNAGLFIKIILGKVKTPFTWGTGPGEFVYIYRPGIIIDWHPAKEPYDIGV